MAVRSFITLSKAGSANDSRVHPTDETYVENTRSVDDLLVLHLVEGVRRAEHRQCSRPVHTEGPTRGDSEECRPKLLPQLSGAEMLLRFCLKI